MVDIRVLAAVATPGGPPDPSSFDPSNSISELAGKPHACNVEVRVLASPSSEEFQSALSDFKPTVIYFGAKAVFDQNSGSLTAFTFKDGSTVDGVVGALAGKGVQTLYVDGKANFEAVKAAQSRGDVAHAIAWPASESGPPTPLSAQFSRTFFATLLAYGAPVNECYTMASHVVQTWCTTTGPDGHVVPPLPVLLSPLKAELPDNNSIPALDLPGTDPTQSIASLVPGWSDLRLLAPRAEVRLLLAGGASLIDSHRLTFLGEALRALLIMETRSASLVSTSSCSKVPVNLASGCAAVRCEVKTASGRPAVVVLGGQPSVLKDVKLVEHALRMTLVSDSQSLQFRLPPPGVSVPPPRMSAAIAGGCPVVDTLVLSSVWAVQVLRALCEDAASLGLISMGVAAVGASATAGLSPADVQRLKMLVSGDGPSEHPLAALMAMPEPADAGGASGKETKEEPGEVPPAPPPLAGTTPSGADDADEAAAPPPPPLSASKPPALGSTNGAAAPAPDATAAENGGDDAMETDAPAAQTAAPSGDATAMETDVQPPPAPA